MVECLLCKCEALSSFKSHFHQRQRERKRERERERKTNGPVTTWINLQRIMLNEKDSTRLHSV
jgi:hypothetical protein